MHAYLSDTCPAGNEKSPEIMILKLLHRNMLQ